MNILIRDLDDHAEFLDTMLRCGRLYEMKGGKPCVITPQEVRGAEQLPLRFTIRHGLSEETSFVANLPQKKSA